MAITPFCTKCGNLKTGSYIKEYTCGPCKEARRSELRRQRREAAGLPAYGSGRDPKCKICRKEKEESYKNGAWCRECKLKHEKERYALKSLKEGRPVKKKVLKVDCAKCGKEKERLDQAYCNECKAEKKRQAYAKKKEQGIVDNSAKTDLEAFKRKTRKLTHLLISQGYVEIKPCEVCGTTELLEAHHDDYNKPEQVRWLCRKHHAEHHAFERGKSLSEEQKKALSEKQEKELLSRIHHELKEHAHGVIKKWLRNKWIEKTPCAVCNEQEVIAFHEDYMRPYEVTWLCRKHHNAKTREKQLNKE